MEFFYLSIFLAVYSFSSAQSFPRDWNRAPYSHHTLMLSNVGRRPARGEDLAAPAFGSDAISTNVFREPLEDVEPATAAKDDPADAPWPFARGGAPAGAPGGAPGGAGVYSAFFPINLARDAPDGGAATAIANSFSTGRGGVASSHATSFGDPYLGMLFRNAVFRKKNEKEE